MKHGELRFWGVRGSIPTPGPLTARVGGNTSCVEVQLGEERIFLDGGSGLRAFAQSHGALPLRAHLLFSHLHWDHIQGVPFFTPLYHPQTEVTLVGPSALREALARQMSGPTFPIGLDALQATLRFVTLDVGACTSIGAVRVRTGPLRHPGGAMAYRLEHDGFALVYACDTEHPAQGLDTDLLALARDADVLIYDAQYTPEEFPGRRGWGHSTWVAAAELALEADVGQLYLTHHDPTRTDTEVASLEAQARQVFCATHAAREQLVRPLEKRRDGGSERRHARTDSTIGR